MEGEYEEELISQSGNYFVLLLKLIDLEGEDSSDLSDEEITFNKILSKRQKTDEKASKSKEEEKISPESDSEDILEADFELVAP